MEARVLAQSSGRGFTVRVVVGQPGPVLVVRKGDVEVEVPLWPVIAVITEALKQMAHAGGGESAGEE